MKTDINSIHKTAHILKSSCAHVGANRLSELCFKLELGTENTKDLKADDIRLLISLINKEFNYRRSRAVFVNFSSLKSPSRR